MVASERETIARETGPRIYENLSSQDLIDHALAQGIDDARLARSGALVVNTGEDTGRAEDAKYFLQSETTQEVNFETVNKPIRREGVNRLYDVVGEHLGTRAALYTQDHTLGADPKYTIDVTTISENAWSTAFAKNLFRPPTLIKPESNMLNNRFRVLHAPSLKLKGEVPEIMGDKAIVLDPENFIVTIVGTRYAGEIKKSVFTVLQLLYEKMGIATMHCSANIDEYGRLTLFFGLSGTGKTTLSMDGKHLLIGDDEHGWSEDGVFTFEGGSYAKVLGLTEKDEPEIWRAVQRRGAIIENAVLDPDGMPIFSGKPENMRGAFPISHFSKVEPSGMGGHPNTIFFLTADAMGVMPVASKLTLDQALYHYASGYTSKGGGTVKGFDGVTPEFSACYGKPFLPYPPPMHIRQFGEKLANSEAEVWLINTGWLGGMQNGGKRNLELTRAVVEAIMQGNISDEVTIDPLGFKIPKGMQDVPTELLHARSHWQDQSGYDAVAPQLEEMFANNIAQFEGQLPKSVMDAGPHRSV